MRDRRLLVLVALMSFAGASPPPPRIVPPSSSVLVATTANDLRLSGGAAVTANPLSNLRSGNPEDHAVATFAVPLSPGTVVTSVSFE